MAPTLPLRRVRGNSGVVALAGLGDATGGRKTNFERVVIGVAVVAARVVGQRVLVAGLFGHSRVKAFHGAAVCGVVNVAARGAGVLGQTGESAPRRVATYRQAVD